MKRVLITNSVLTRLHRVLLVFCNSLSIFFSSPKYFDNIHTDFNDWIYVGIVLVIDRKSPLMKVCGRIITLMCLPAYMYLRAQNQFVPIVYIIVKTYLAVNYTSKKPESVRKVSAFSSACSWSSYNVIFFVSTSSRMRVYRVSSCNVSITLKVILLLKVSTTVVNLISISLQKLYSANSFDSDEFFKGKFRLWTKK